MAGDMAVGRACVSTAFLKARWMRCGCRSLTVPTRSQMAVGDGPHACVAALRGPPPVRDVALAKLHALLLGGARLELNRRCEALSHVPSGALDDLAIRAADDSLVAILPKLDNF